MIYQIPPRNIKGRETVAYWDDFLKEEQINAILARNEWLNLSKGSVGGQVSSDQGSYTPEIRESNVCWLQFDKDVEGLWDTLSRVFAEVNSEFFHIDITGLYEPIQLSVYDANAEHQGHYTWHTDMAMSDRHVPRKLSMCLLLSDPTEFEGGQLEVKPTSDEPMILEQKRGRAWFFPSYVLHRVTPVTRGIRRSLVLWAGGPPFR